MVKATAEFQAEVLKAIQEHGPLTMEQLAERVGKSDTYIRAAITQLGEKVTATKQVLKRENGSTGFYFTYKATEEKSVDLENQLRAAQSGNVQLREENNRLQRELNDERQKRYDAEVRNRTITVQDLEQAGSRMMAEDREKIEDLEKRINELEARNERLEVDIASALQARDNTETLLAQEEARRKAWEEQAEDWRARAGQAESASEKVSELEELLKIAEHERDVAVADASHLRESLAEQRAANPPMQTVEWKNKAESYDRLVAAITAAWWDGEDAVEIEELRDAANG